MNLCGFISKLISTQACDHMSWWCRNKLSEVHSEHSQSEQIVWDDPTAREERARLAKKLHVNCSQGEQEPSSSSSPQQEWPSTEHSAKSSPAIDGALTANRGTNAVLTSEVGVLLSKQIQPNYFRFCNNLRISQLLIF